MKKLDIIIIVICLFLGFGGLVYVGMSRLDGGEVHIYVEGREYGSYTLDSEETVEITRGNKHNSIIIRNNSVVMSESSCSNQICVHQGSISNSSESICCVPNGIIVVISAGNKEEEFDAISH